MIAAIYARKSTEQTGVADEQKSVTRQVEHARAYAQRKGWTVDEAHVYVDDGISGAEFANRPGFLRLMNALKPKAPFQVLIMSEESRLGREAIETAYALKQLVTAGVRVFFYLEDRERTLDSPTDKIMMSLTAFADELEREKARQRTYDAMLRKARAGHVTGGRVFGYENVAVNSHVERRINGKEAAVVCRIFELCVEGKGLTAIAKTLNAERAPSPRAQQGRPSGWAPSSVREVLYRSLYRGEIVWNQTRKRDQWGQVRQRARNEADWLRVDVQHLRVVSDELWQAAHDRLSSVRDRYLRLTNGRVIGRPPASGTKYLLSGMLCCPCGSTFEALSRKHGRRRAFVYGCAAHRRRGQHVCANDLVVPMDVADEAVLSAVEQCVLSAEIVEQAIDQAVSALTVGGAAERRQHIEGQLASISDELTRLSVAIAAGGGDLPVLVDAIRTREVKRAELEQAIGKLKTQAPLPDRTSLRAQLRKRLEDWRGLLRRRPQQGQQILQRLIRGRITFMPQQSERGRYYAFRATGTLTKLLSGLVQNVASPTGFEPVFRP
jgi:site-specific DNA recombinase